jgi:hypothetical protein
MSIRNIALISVATVAIGLHAESDEDAKSEYFELKVRPILAKNCYTCHTEARAGVYRWIARKG